MVQTIIASQVLANGLRTEFTDTYSTIRNRQADSRLASVMDLNVGATNRHHEFAYFEAAPHVELWRRGSAIPTDGMGSVRFTATVQNWARRVAWHKDDRKDDQTQSLMTLARMAGESAALLPERMFFDLIRGTTNTLPAVPTAPDGAAFFATTAGGAARFGATNGNLLSGSGVASTAAILTNYYTALAQFMAFQDGKGQPLLSPETVAAGVIIVFGSANLQVFEQAFYQVRQGVLGPDNSTDAVTSVGVSNIVQDASRNVMLWPTPRITDNDWFIFLKSPPKQSTFLLNREGVQEFSSLEGDNNSDLTRDTGEEYIQWELRQGAGIALPYGAIEINN